MNDAHLSLTFFLADADALDTLEAVLAIARRGGVRLQSLQLAPRGERCKHVALGLTAAERDLLELFLARLRNLFCIEDMRIAE